MRFKFISGCSSGKPNLFLLIKNNGKAVVFDCGFQSEMPDFSKIEEDVEEVFITHAHADHIGGLTLLKQMFPNAKIYMSEPTAEIGKITIGSLEIKDKYRIPMKEIETTMNSVEFIKEDMLVKFDDYKVMPIRAGHLLGALSYLIRFDSNLILYTGDVSLFELPLAGKFEAPLGNVDVVISESNFTIGIDSFNETLEKIASLVASAIKLKGRVIFPLPAAGRAQEIAAYLAYKIINNEIPHATIYVDGSIRDVIRIYDTYSSNLNGYLAKFYQNMRSSGLIKLVPDYMRKDLVRNEKPLIVLTTSANLKHGQSLFYVEEVFLDENATILFTGRVDDKTIAKRILVSKKGELIEFKGIALSRKCNVVLYELNEHGNVMDLINLLKRISAKALILVHGNELVKNYISQFLLKENSRFAVTDPLEGDMINITKLIKLSKLIKFIEDEEFFEALLERSIYTIKNDYDRNKKIDREYLEGLLEKNDLLIELRNLERIKLLFFIFFRYGVKASYKNYKIDFKFVADVLEVLGESIAEVMGKSAVAKLFQQLNETAPKFFKNLILRGGTMKANLGIEIISMENLKEILENFNANFSRFGVKMPEISEIKKLCEQEILQDKSLKANYERVFG